MQSQPITSAVPGGYRSGKRSAPPSLTASTPPWSRAQPFERLAESYSVIHKLGGKVFTLRLSLDALVTVTGSADPTRVISRRIQAAFRKHGLPAPLFSFSLEVTPDEREELHLHGGIELGNLDPAAVKLALRIAGGKISGRAGSRQVQIKNFNLDAGGPMGWANYVKVTASRTRRVLGHDRIVYIGRELLQLARQDWEQRRRPAPGVMIA